MKKILLPVFAVSALLLNSCSTTQLARQADNNDDVYYTEAKAKVITPVVYTQTDKQEQTYRTDEQLYGDERYSDNRFEDDYSFSARINRFYYNSPYRPYYDYRYSYGYNPWYTYSYDPFFYDPWLYRPGVSLWVGVGRYPRWGNSYYGYYGGGYNNGYWGPYSYYNTYPGYGYGGYYGGGYYSGNYNNSNSRPKPNRESGIGRSGNTYNSPGGVTVPSTGRPNRGSSAPNRTPDGRISSDRGNSTSAQPSSSGSTRPSRTREVSQPQPQPEPASRPTRDSSRPDRSWAPSSSGSSSSSGGSSSGGSSSGGSTSSGSRPSRR